MNLTPGPVHTLPDPVRRLPSPESYGPGVFLVRPDGYVGWAGDTAQGLAEYARRTGAWSTP